LRLRTRHLSPSHRPALLEHFGALSRRDLYLRFGTFASPESIAARALISTSHNEADGFIDVPPAMPFSAALELTEEQIGVVDYAFKAQRAAWRQVLRRSP
jgi:hypothetical protein